MKKLAIGAVAALTLAFAGCTSVTPGYGIATQAVVEGVSMNKTGTAEGTFLLGGLIPLKADVSVATAAKNGNIKKIATVDTKVFSILGIYIKKTTIVTGE